MKIIPLIYPFQRSRPGERRCLGKALNEQIKYFPEDCWISVQDYDVMWPQIKIPSMELMYRYVEAYPETGLFTSYASRTKNPAQKYENGMYEDNDSMLFWQQKATELMVDHGAALTYADIMHEISGYHMLFPWTVWKENPFSESCELLRMDNEFSWGVHRLKKPIRLMKALLCMHFYRLHTHINDISHLKEEQS